MDILETHAYDRRQRRNTSCLLFLSLFPFFLSAALYFYWWIPLSEPSLLAAAVKSAPTFSLALLVLSYNGGRSLVGVAGGLFFSVGGDCCLIWDELFLAGMACFAVTHVLYSVSFLSSHYSSHSSSSLSFFFYLLLWLTGGGTYAYLFPHLQKSHDSSILTPAVGVYVLLLVLMVTLALRTRQPLMALGSLSFIVSDFTLAIQHFKVVPNLEHGRLFVMTTYYLSQLLIAVGDVRAGTDEAAEFHKWKRS
ncbi:lysoplasmalogenase [Chanos chanos]|uniref:lysoplasmalogenase n=1 Tax=Chanos chanos TaxID=29144 RepID=A0A6J2WZJ3_CHACN|nr:lysoplasmalogenase-like protein TMEM86A [Chanos chanos]